MRRDRFPLLEVSQPTHCGVETMRESVASASFDTGDITLTDHERIRVLLVDDHVVMRAGARRILEDEPDILVVGEAGEGKEALAMATTLRPDIVALDIDMPGMDGIRACQELLAREYPPRVLALTGHDKEAYVRTLSSYGVHGYLLKSAGPEELVSAIRAIHAGQTVFSGAIAEALMRASHAPAVRVTAKEREVLHVLSRGARNQEIAEELSISLNTVEFHMRNLMSKLGATSRTDAVLRAQRLGWLDLSLSDEEA
jgi:NarL family two-component system response regulator LiaR